VPGALIRADREIKKAAIGSRYIWAATYSRGRQHVLMCRSRFSWAAAGRAAGFKTYDRIEF
jgi:hypothetical protein